MGSGESGAWEELRSDGNEDVETDKGVTGQSWTKYGMESDRQTKVGEVLKTVV